MFEKKKTIEKYKKCNVVKTCKHRPKLAK